MRIISDNPIHDKIFQFYLRTNQFIKAGEYVLDNNLVYEYLDLESTFTINKPFQDYLPVLNKKPFDKDKMEYCWDKMREIFDDSKIEVWTAKCLTDGRFSSKEDREIFYNNWKLNYISEDDIKGTKNEKI